MYYCLSYFLSGKVTIRIHVCIMYRTFMAAQKNLSSVLTASVTCTRYVSLRNARYVGLRIVQGVGESEFQRARGGCRGCPGCPDTRPFDTVPFLKKNIFKTLKTGAD